MSFLSFGTVCAARHDKVIIIISSYSNSEHKGWEEKRKKLIILAIRLLFSLYQCDATKIIAHFKLHTHLTLLAAFLASNEIYGCGWKPQNEHDIRCTNNIKLDKMNVSPLRVRNIIVHSHCAAKLFLLFPIEKHVENRVKLKAR